LPIAAVASALKMISQFEISAAQPSNNKTIKLFLL